MISILIFRPDKDSVLQPDPEYINSNSSQIAKAVDRAYEELISGDITDTSIHAQARLVQSNTTDNMYGFTIEIIRKEGE